jgi:hypothetical protein
MTMPAVIRARGYGPSVPMPFRDQSISTPSGAAPPIDRRDNGSEEPVPRGRENNAGGGRTYVMTLPAGEYRGEDDEASGLMHLHRRDRGGEGGGHVCSVPAGEYEIERDESGVHVYRVQHGDEERRGEEGEGEERDQAMGRNVMPRAPRLGRGRDLGPTELQKLRAYKERLSAHYDQYRNWIRERTS